MMKIYTQCMSKQMYLSVAVYFIFSLLHCMRSDAVELVIDQPGIYTLANSISINPTTPDTFVFITTSSVVFDLGSFSLNQLGSQAGVDGIVITSTNSDIVLQNGIISNVSGFGVRVFSPAARITLQKIAFVNCATGGIQMQGVTIFNRIADITIQDCSFDGCCLGATAQAVIDCATCTRLAIEDCTIGNIDTLSPFTTPLTLIRCANIINGMINNITIQDIRIPTSSGVLNQLVGISLDASCSEVIIKNSTISRFALSSSSFAVVPRAVGVLIDSASGCTVEKMLIQNARVTGVANPTLIGIDLVGGSAQTINKCTMQNNQAALIYGIRVSGVSSGHEILNCLVGQHDSSSWISAYRIESDAVRLIRCMALNNSNSNSIGIDLVANNCTVVDCICVANGSAGISNSPLSSLPDNFFARTICQANGTTKQQQLSGVSLLTQQRQARTALNSALYPWSNIGSI